jgi:hypothetical protein
LDTAENKSAESPTLFELTVLVNFSSDNLSDYQVGNKIAELVLMTGETINIADAHQDSRFDPSVMLFT